MKLLFQLTLLLWFAPAFAQSLDDGSTTPVAAADPSPDNYWYFGQNVGLDFSTDPPTVTTNSAMNVLEGCATACDPNSGALHFYTNGISVWDATDNLMPNGTGLIGSNTSTQSALVVPNSAHAGTYYLFTTDGNGASNLLYSEIDMSLNGGLGEVLSATKNTTLDGPVAEKITATKHANGTDYWVLVHG